MPKNILFDETKMKIQARQNDNVSPICAISGKPMIKVICGSFNKKKMYVWFSPAARLIIPIFKTGE
jgi:hypothetical protein